ncbi:hypothetical protein B0H11DRAFT_1914468 [Mycena galericulata]|nr:hypothetical protein B0H11DRAFT_1914468 [Mycena galericulata]
MTAESSRDSIEGRGNSFERVDPLPISIFMRVFEIPQGVMTRRRRTASVQNATQSKEEVELEWEHTGGNTSLGHQGLDPLSGARHTYYWPQLGSARVPGRQQTICGNVCGIGSDVEF